MHIENNYSKKIENWNLEDTLNFINKCLIVFEKVNVKDKNKLVCYEEEFDTLDFNEVPYLLRNEYEIPEYLVEEIKKLEILIKQLYIEKEIVGITTKNGIVFLLNYNNKIYNIKYENNIMTFSKIKTNKNMKELQKEIINFEYLKGFVEQNKKTL